MGSTGWETARVLPAAATAAVYVATLVRHPPNAAEAVNVRLAIIGTAQLSKPGTVTWWRAKGLLPA